MITGIGFVAVHAAVDGTQVVVSAQLALGTQPEPGAHLSDWVSAGWSLGKAHGNGDRGFILQIQQAGGIVAKQRAFITVEKNGKRQRVTSRTLAPADAQEPDDWKCLDNWIAEGWAWSDVTGNAEHSFGMFLERDTEEDDPSA